jgi:glycosidase
MTHLRRILAPLLVLLILGGATHTAHGSTAHRTVVQSINKSAVFHDELSSAYRKPFGAVPKGTPVHLSVRTAHNGATKVTLQTVAINAAGDTSPAGNHAMKIVSRGKRYDRWSATFTPSTVSMYGYRFQVQRGSATYTYGKLRLIYGGAQNCQFTATVGSPYFELTSYDPNFTAPSWAPGMVIYQIFPDRFFNGDPSNDRSVMNPVYGGQHPTFHTSESDAPVPGGEDFYGGDLQGVIDKLPYLKSQGVTAIWLNPIFLAPSNHKYDTSDYYTIDPHFGSQATFDALVKAMHADGMHLLLDGVFNHTGSDSVYFNRFNDFHDVGADQSTSSPYYGFYSFSSFPNSYATFCGVGSLPQLQENDAVKDFIFRKPDSVAQHWLADGSDGWRLDGASFKSHAWWAQFRSSVKAAHPNALLIGENSADARDSTPFLLGNELDGVMNYRFRSAVDSFFAAPLNPNVGLPTGASDMWNSLMDVVQSYPMPALESSMNVVDSHDTSRILTDLAGNTAELKQVATLQMTWVGAPTVLYGDEAGLQGNTDPDDRRFFPWSHANTDLQAYYRTLATARAANSALRDGSVSPLIINDSRRIVSFARRDTNTLAMVAINDGTAARTLKLSFPSGTSPRAMTDVLGGSAYSPSGRSLSVSVPAKSSVVLVPRR